jgi:hypothetical protein
MFHLEYLSSHILYDVIMLNYYQSFHSKNKFNSISSQKIFYLPDGYSCRKKSNIIFPYMIAIGTKIEVKYYTTKQTDIARETENMTAVMRHIIKKYGMCTS